MPPPTGRGGYKGARGGRNGITRDPPKKGGPRPARHIPWPEIFKRHISVVEGHLKMVDMVRKHTVEGSEDHRTISQLLQQADQCLRDAKTLSRTFKPPKDAWKNVPIGSSSDSMYPGYSPGDYVYGEAAEEHGRAKAELKKQGQKSYSDAEVAETNNIEAGSAKRRRTEDATAAGSTEEKPIVGVTTAEPKLDSSAGNAPGLFFVDSTGQGTATREPSMKRSKKSHVTKSASSETDAQTTSAPEPEIEYDNIDREVDARLKLKEEAKKEKKEKKRKRESTEIATVHDKPSKKKSKAESKDAADEPADSVDVEMEDVGEALRSDSKNKKNKKDKKERKSSSVQDDVAEAGEQKKKKKHKKQKISDDDGGE